MFLIHKNVDSLCKYIHKVVVKYHNPCNVRTVIVKCFGLIKSIVMALALDIRYSQYCFRLQIILDNITISLSIAAFIMKII